MIDLRQAGVDDAAELSLSLIHIYIGPRIKDFLCLSGKQPQARGIFPVDHSEIHLFFPLQRPQPAHEKIQSILAHHISDRQHPKFHTVPPSR